MDFEGTFVVDGITLALFLDDQFADEMRLVRESVVINSEEQEPLGVLRLGEISAYGEGLLKPFKKPLL